MTDDFEAMLARLRPAAATADPVAAAYAAGQRSANARWAGVAAVLTIAAVLPWTIIDPHRPTAVVVRLPTPPAVRDESVPVVLPAEGTARQLQSLVLAGGLDALPRSPLPDLPPVRAYGP